MVNIDTYNGECRSQIGPVNKLIFHINLNYTYIVDTGFPNI